MSSQAHRTIWGFWLFMSITGTGSCMETASRASVGHSGPLTLHVGQVLQLMGPRRCHCCPKNILHVLLGEGRKKKDIKRRICKKSNITTGAVSLLSLFIAAGCAISHAPAVQHSSVPQESAFGSSGETLLRKQE